MASEVRLFENPEFGQVRSVMMNEEPWFVGKDVADILGYSNGNRDIVRHVEEEDRENIDNETQYRFGIELGQRGGWLINESGLYSLILSSKLPKAKEFKHWVTSEVLPDIRKHGMYMSNEVVESVVSDPANFLKVLSAYVDSKNRVEELEAENAEQQKEIEVMKPKASYCDRVLQTKNAVNITTIAKDYGLSAVTLNKMLHEYGIQYKQGGTWLLYQQYADMGYTKTTTNIYTNASGEECTSIHTKWTQKGRLFIYETLKEHGILPLMETEEETEDNVIQFAAI